MSWNLFPRAKRANSSGSRIRRRGSSRHVIKNHRSETTSRRSRDMRGIIAKSRRQGQTAPMSALPVTLRYPVPERKPVRQEGSDETHCRGQAQALLLRGADGNEGDSYSWREKATGAAGRLVRELTRHRNRTQPIGKNLARSAAAGDMLCFGGPHYIRLSSCGLI